MSCYYRPLYISHGIRELLDGLQRVGLCLSWGEDDSGFYTLIWGKAGRYYFGMLPRFYILVALLSLIRSFKNLTKL